MCMNQINLCGFICALNTHLYVATIACSYTEQRIMNKIYYYTKLQRNGNEIDEYINSIYIYIRENKIHIKKTPCTHML